jgi:hypothetical protein
MSIGDKGVFETLAIWGLPALLLLGIIFAIWGSFADPGRVANQF